MLALKIEFDKGRKLDRMLRSMRSDIRDLRWAWPFVTKSVVAYHRRIFDTEGAAGSSGPWEPLASMTIRLRLGQVRVSNSPPFDYASSSSESGSGRILHWHHRLRDAVASEGGTGDSVREGTYRSYTFGVDKIPYASELQDGGLSQFRRPIPARPFVDMLYGPVLAVNSVGMALSRRWRAYAA